MTTLSVPLTPRIESYVNSMVESGFAETKAGAVRKILLKSEEDAIIEEILQSSREAHEGKVFRGDLDELVKKFK